MEERLNKLREERIAREKARIQKLKELNLKKYPKLESQATSSTNPPANSDRNKLIKSSSVTQIKNGAVTKNLLPKHVKNNFHVNGTTKRPITVPVTKKTDYANVKPKVVSKIALKSSQIKDLESNNNVPKSTDNKQKPVPNTCSLKADSKIPITSKSKVNLKPDLVLETDKATTLNDMKTSNQAGEKEKKVLTEITKKEIINPKIFAESELKSRKSLAVPSCNKVNSNIARKSMLPEATKSESVFERLYKPKYVAKKPTDEVSKLQSDPNFLKKIIKNSGLISSGLHKRHTVFDTTNKTGNTKVPPRRSISAFHFKRIRKDEIGIYKWASIGDKLNDKHDIEMNEDEKINEDKVISAIRSDRKKVKFMTPVPSNFNTPRPEELQARLKSWLQKRGKSLDSYQHLQCFGINHLKTPMGTPKLIQFNDHTLTNNGFDEENKENIALDSDSDDGSYVDTMNEPQDTLCSGDKVDTMNWRRASIDSESLGFNDTNNFNETTVTSADTLTNVDELLNGALNDLTALLREDFDWQQSARWLRSIRERFPHATRGAAYWECRAALEEKRGDLAASVHCWEQAIAAGTEHSVVESNLDQLLDKFMQLKISPRSGAARLRDPKQLDMRNVFKSTIIKFAVQQAKLRRQSEHPETPMFTVTPVRRSARLSHCATSATGRTPLRLCDSVRQAAAVAPQHQFTPNDHFV